MFSVLIHYIQNGDSALIVASRKGKTEVVKVLLREGADMNLQSNVCQ